MLLRISLRLLAAAALISGLGSLSNPGRAQEGDLTRLTEFAEFGETKYKAGFPHFDYVNPDAPKGGEVRIAVYGTFERINPIPLGPAWPQGLAHVYDSLMTGSGDELASYYPAIANSLEVPDDVSYAIFNLDPEARWHDDHPITAEDFVYALETIKEHARPLLREFWRNLDSAEALGKHRLRIDFATRNNYKTLGLAASLGPMPKHFYEETERSPGEISTEPAVYEGPYRIARVEIGRSITYERVEDYWAADRPDQVGVNNFDRITYVYFRDMQVAFEAFKSGDIDFWSENRAQRWATGYDIPQVKNGLIIRDESIEINQPRGFAGLVFNTRREPLDDVHVREAISKLFDFQWLQENIFYGQYQRARSYFPNSDYGVRDAPQPSEAERELLEPYRDQLPQELFTQPFEPTQTEGSGRIRRQLREAWRLFEEAGWEVRNGELRNAETGEQMQIEIITPTDSSLRYLQPFVRNMQRAGINASARNIDSAQFQRVTDTFEYDMVDIGANFFPPPNEELRTYFSSDAADEEGSANWAGVRNPVVDALLERIVAIEGRTSEDLEKLKTTTRALDRVLLWNHYIVPTYYSARHRLAFWDLFGRPQTLPVYGTGFPSIWWWDPTDRAVAETRN